MVAMHRIRRVVDQWQPFGTGAGYKASAGDEHEVRLDMLMFAHVVTCLRGHPVAKREARVLAASLWSSDEHSHHHTTSFVDDIFQRYEPGAARGESRHRSAIGTRDRPDHSGAGCARWRRR